MIKKISVYNKLFTFSVLETQIEICKRNLNLNQNEYEKAENLLEEVMKMLNKSISNLRTTAYDLNCTLIN